MKIRFTCYSLQLDMFGKTQIRFILADDTVDSSDFTIAGDKLDFEPGKSYEVEITGPVILNSATVAN